MSYFINPVEEEKCVFLTHEGEMSLVETALARQEARALLTARRWTRLLVDITVTRTVFRAGDVFELAAAISRDVPRSARIALLVRPDQVKHAKLIETVARRGGKCLAFFVNNEKAEAWVRGLSPIRTRCFTLSSQHPIPQRETNICTNET